MKALVFFLFVFSLNSGLAKTSVFTILNADGEAIGSLKASMTTENGVDILSVESRVTVNKFFDISVSYDLKSVFKSGKLINNNITTYFKNKVRDKISTKKTESGYVYQKNEDIKQISDFEFCESMLYFNEPVGINKIYSEINGNFKPTVFVENEQSYALTNPDNHNVNKYFYQNGILNKAVVHAPFFTIYLHLITHY